ncbi:translational GTPase TypA [Immundisolibacter cernigliae]|uniref:Large ribosomal subunit assembly factor BipA n=1 Tax=Immundisolibacter cernigliae TaxID=1810504 RepID=A0A1B1YVZ8_9GAMM|nr:translational GTPase TypA [Immundisolibacter cernigliae]ANX04952.1 GTP-binding protein TypA [Immundisolibacter cernigliae]
MSTHIRNIAIIAHVDHGKTTLVDQLLRQSGTFAAHEDHGNLVMDSNDLERERGITITAKNTAVDWTPPGGDTPYRINIVDTPGHADFGGEVERILSMVDSVLLLVDAVDGPMPQTRFVTEKAFAAGLHPIVIINKVDRPGARPDWVLNQTFDLFDRLGASDEQLDFPVVYTSALMGYAGLDDSVREGDMTPLFQTIVDKVPPPQVEVDGPLQMQISALGYSSYVGVIGIGRIRRGTLRRGQSVMVVGAGGTQRRGRALQVLAFRGLERYEVEQASAGDIIAVTGVEGLAISDTLCDPERPEAMPALTVDEPTITMNFEVNKSPFAGRDGQFLTSRQLRERLYRELLTNIALRVEDGEDPDVFRVSGRGELHLSILIETMRREGYELAVSRPQVIIKEIDGVACEPYEQLTIDVDSAYQGNIMELIGARRGELTDMVPDGRGRVRLDYRIPTRGLIGLRTDFLSASAGTGLMHHVFDAYAPVASGEVAVRKNGVLISNGTGKAVGFALFNLQERGRLMVGPGDEVYEGQVIGLHSRGNDLTVNPLKAKQLTNMRASGSDENIVLTPHTRQSLEQALEFIENDELVEVTPHFLRVRKRHLLESDRRRHSRAAD